MVVIKSEEPLTGFEQKTLKTVILNWLYHKDEAVILAAATELQNRFRQMPSMTKPDWATD